VKEGVNVRPEDVDEDQLALTKLAGSKKALVLVDGSAFHTMTPEAVEKLAGYMGKTRHATAIVSQSLGVRIFVNTISRYLNCKSPFQMFTSETQALKWLMSHKRTAQKRTKRNVSNTSVAPRVHKKPKAKMCEVSIDKNGILTKKVYNGAHLDVDMVKNAEKEAIKLAGGKKILTLVDHRANYTITTAALKYIHKNVRAKYRLATALIAPKPWRVEPEILGKKNSRNLPLVKVFNDKASAVKWLLSLKKKTR
jgi:hypothetical protein